MTTQKPNIEKGWQEMQYIRVWVFFLRMFISFLLVFKKGPNLESAKNKRCSLTITGTSDKKDLHHLQNPSQWCICLWIFSNCSLSSKCNNPYINWQGISSPEFDTHSLPCTSCSFMLEIKCLCSTFALFSSWRIL